LNVTVEAALNPRTAPELQEPIDLASAEPTDAELDAIDVEWPLIAAELELLDVQLAIMAGAGPLDDFEVRRLRHAQREVIRAALAHVQHLAHSRRVA
jgi:hypothetical protein